MIRRIILFFGTVALLAGCNAELGRMPWEKDVGCLRQQLDTPAHQSFAMAANLCQRSNHGTPVPLNLRGAPDLQKAAEEANIAYTP